MIASDWLDPQPLNRAHGLPACAYTDTALLQRERVAVFARSWQLVAHRAQLAHPGDHVVCEVADTPLAWNVRSAASSRALRVARASSLVFRLACR